MSFLYYWHTKCLTKLQSLAMLLCSMFEVDGTHSCNATENLANGSAALPQVLVSKQVLAARYGVCVRTIHNLMRKRILPWYSIGRAVRFHPVECDAALAKLKRISVLEGGTAR